MLDKPAFLTAMTDRYLAVVPDWTEDAAREMAVTTFEEWLRTEKIDFGHHDYDWTEYGAHCLVDEELSYWED